MGLQFPSCTTFELIEVLIPDQPHQELTAKEIMGLKMAIQQRQQQGNRGCGRGAGGGNIITRLDEIRISQNRNQRSAHTHTHTWRSWVRLSLSSHRRCQKTKTRLIADFVKKQLPVPRQRMWGLTCSPVMSEAASVLRTNLTAC